MKTEHSPHRWRFFRAGGLDHVKLDSVPDLVHLEHLDQKLWVALSCPVKGLEFDARTLELIDTDGDGQVRVDEVMDAVQWAEDRLRDLSLLIDDRQELPLAAINDDTETGKVLLASARRILENLGKPEAESISVADASDVEKIFGDTKFNGDGIVPVDAAGDDEEVRRALEEIIDALGAEDDRSGAPGVSQEKADRFFDQLRSLADWRQRAEADAANVLPFGDETAAAAAAVDEVGEKVDDYFSRCRLAAYDPSAVEALNQRQSEYLDLASKTLSRTAEEVAAFPLARIEAGRPLPLGEELNPAWAGRIARMIDLALRPLFGDGETALSPEQWHEIQGKITAYRDWQAAKPETDVEALGRERVRSLLAADIESRIAELIAKDKALEAEAVAIEEVEQLARYRRDLYRLLKNFVSFSDFYDPDLSAIFQAGTLYLDGRSCELCVRVDNPGKHAKLAAHSDFYLAYCDCVGAGGKTMKIVAAFTNGDGDSLRVGRNGLFYDRCGQDWDATITQVIEKPISVRDAFWFPYKRFGALMEAQVVKLGSSADKSVADSTKKGIESAEKTIEAGEAAAAPPFDIAKFAGIFAAIGLALGAIATAVAAGISGFFGLEPWQMPLAIAGMLLAISGPSMLLAAVKLRRRNLGPILDANGWAVNGDVRVNIPFGASLTQVAKLPQGASRSLRDPFPRKRRRWPWLLLLLALLAAAGWWLNEKGYLHAWGLGSGEEVSVEESS